MRNGFRFRRIVPALMLMCLCWVLCVAQPARTGSYIHPLEFVQLDGYRTATGEQRADSRQRAGRGGYRPVAADPGNADIFYLAAADGGVWKTTDGGVTWTPLTDSQITLAMGALAVAPGNSDFIYAGTGEANNPIDSLYGMGVLKSTDGGQSWTLEIPPASLPA